MKHFVLKTQKLFNIRMRRMVLIMGMMAFVILAFEAVILHSWNALSHFFPGSKFPVFEENFPSKPTLKSSRVGKLFLSNDSHNSSSEVLKVVEMSDISDIKGDDNHHFSNKETDGDTEKYHHSDDYAAEDKDSHSNRESLPNRQEGAISKRVINPVRHSFALARVDDRKGIGSLNKFVGPSSDSSSVLSGVSKPEHISVLGQVEIVENESLLVPVAFVPTIPNDPALTMVAIVNSVRKNNNMTAALSGKQAKYLPKGEARVSTATGSATSRFKSGVIIPWVKKKMSPVYISEMNSLLLRNHASDQVTRRQWSSSCDKEIISAKRQIETAPIAKKDRELHAPLYRNISVFKRSYDLMQKTLKIYVYEEGNNPIFHQPLLKGIYASEGWFMSLMKTNTHFVVKDPRKAHLFYMPFSSRYLQLVLYQRSSHNWMDLEEYLKKYVDIIAARYPFWNRTGGADHFLVACHDWAPFETRHVMAHSIRALCTADLRSGFQLGKDVSLPQTNVRSPFSPLRELGGRPGNRRHTLAFFAGNMHGSLRPKLLRHWENKDPGMKIFGLLPGGIKERKTAYIQQMKSSKYCICPKGHEANSPRVVESIFYECVPVIISDNYIPPFFEVLNWEAFSVILREREIPRLKEILESIPEQKYLALQMGVKKVQKHFLWHRKPIKYDLFHMILHSIWFNRVHQI